MVFQWSKSVALAIIGVSLSYGMEGEERCFISTKCKEVAPGKMVVETFVDPREFLKLNQLNLTARQPVKVAIIDHDFDYWGYREGDKVFPKLSPSFYKAAEASKPEAMEKHRQSLVQGGLITMHGTFMTRLLGDLADNVVLCPVALNSYKSINRALQVAINTKADFVLISMPLHNGHHLAMDQRLQDIFEKLYERGVGVIISAGNHRIKIGTTPYSKSLADLASRLDGHMLLVGASEYLVAEGVGICEQMASYSNTAGAACDHFITAPGGMSKIYGVQGMEFSNRSGTSYSAPVVAAMAVTLKGLFPSLSNQHVLRVIGQSARKCFYQNQAKENPLTEDLYPQIYGQGIVDLPAAIRLVQDQFQLEMSEKKLKEAPDDL